MQTAPLFHKPVALVVFLENVGHIAGVKLPQWVMNVIDFVTEEYAKLLLRVLGAHRRYDKVIILEDDQANGKMLSETLLATSRTHRIDVLLLVHGHTGQLVGYRGKQWVGPETFGPLCDACGQVPETLDLRMVYGVNCYGAPWGPKWSMAPWGSTGCRSRVCRSFSSTGCMARPTAKRYNVPITPPIASGNASGGPPLKASPMILS